MQTPPVEHLQSPDDEIRNAAFRVLFQKWQMPIYRYLRGMLGNHADADDAAQESWLQILRAIGQLDQPEALTGWMFRIAHRKALDALARRSRTHARSRALDEIDHPAAPAWVDLDQGEQVFFAAVQALPARQRQVFLLRYFEQLPYESIAQITGVGVNSLKTSHHWAIRKLSHHLRQGIPLNPLAPSLPHPPKNP